MAPIWDINSLMPFHLVCFHLVCVSSEQPICYLHRSASASNASFSHVNLLVCFGFMAQAMTGAWHTLLQPMQRSIYQKPFMTVCALQSLMLKAKHNFLFLFLSGGGREGWKSGKRIKPSAEGGWSAPTAYACWFMKCNLVLSSHRKPLTHGSWGR